MPVIKEIELNQEQINDIKQLHYRINALKGLILEITENSELYNILMEDLSDKKAKYEEWFENIRKEKSIETTSKMSWEVDFNRKILTLKEN